MSGTIFSILPPLIAIVMVLITKRVLVSLGAGIVAGALIAASFNPGGSLSTLWKAFTVSFWDGGLNTYNIFIMLFVLLLGVITAFVSLSGGSRAFAEWATKRIRTRRGAKLLAAFLGILIFVDDYFNALAVGQIARPITDKHKISRAKLAYFIDSTSAPVCAIAPVSSWGAYLIGIIGTILAGATAVSYTPLQAFLLMIPMNFYVLATLVFVFFAAISSNFDFGEMRRHERRALETGELFDPSKQIPGELKEEFPVHNHGRVIDLVLPIVLLVAVTFGGMFITGYRASIAEYGRADIWTIFEMTDVSISLLTGGIAGVLVAALLYAAQMKRNETARYSYIGTAFISGIKAMMPAVSILVFAWALTYLIGELETGAFLSGVVQSANVPVILLPAIMFILAGVMAFATGTSWGSFGILLPIAGQVMLDAAPELLLASLAAVLGGAVFGDHCSPISDSTIMSSTGAGSNHIDHVSTQMPYALMSAGISAIGYVVLGVTDSVWAGILSVVVMLAAVIWFWAYKGRAITPSVAGQQSGD
ncbi:Na+/H+ antiporter NhaC family protein [Edaphobacillus lindanitolerans]|uniref:Transporter, NhaC family n=1 Tax=Edaphobacillus lindanitolerans TaxID=550447 RepID=A0A1U7PSW2_9BACI|nr:Na+/H+ antiporter NhaC family protein [Edaphobacillus lindanitolerans]SIT91888.1 transporter, NhaC family [Edaphobacillus lindanitolerans]